jgi:hypothetical protein
VSTPLPFAVVRRVSLIVVLLAIALVTAAGCSGERPSLAAADPESTSTTEPRKLATLDTRAVDATVVATAVVPTLAVYDAPDAPEPARSFANPLPSSGPLVLLVDRTAAGWLQVVLPSSPAGATGWVRTSDVTVARHNYRIDVHLSEFRLDVHLEGQVVRQIKIGLATGSLPAPGGRYYTTELLQPASPDGVYGTFAYVLSGWSDPPTTFTGAIGQLGIHGTAQADSIGTQATVGSIRMRNEDIEDLATFLPLGVPVTVDG